MKRDWTKPQMRLTVAGYCNDFTAFLLFLRLTLVTGLCLFGPLFVYEPYGHSISAVTYMAAFPLWWWHFGLPRFKDEQSGFISPGFCLFGYLIMSACLAVILLMAFGVIKEGQPHRLPQWFPQSRVVRFLICFAVLSVYTLFKSRITKKGP